MAFDDAMMFRSFWQYIPRYNLLTGETTRATINVLDKVNMRLGSDVAIHNTSVAVEPSHLLVYHNSVNIPFENAIPMFRSTHFVFTILESAADLALAKLRFNFYTRDELPEYPDSWHGIG